MPNDPRSPSSPPPPGVDRAEWQTRVDLAAAYRAAARLRWNDTIYNHLTCRLPGQPHRFLVKRHGLLFSEVTASNLVTVDLDGRPLGFDDDVNPAGFAIHTAVLRARPDVNVCLHVHSVPGVALSARPEGFRYISQESAFLYDRIAYYEFNGIEERIEDSNALAARMLDGDHHTLVLRNHGVLCVGPTLPIAFIRLRYLLTCAEYQMLASNGPTPPSEIPESVCRFTRDQFEAQQRDTGFEPDWRALLRELDREAPDYAS